MLSLKEKILSTTRFNKQVIVAGFDFCLVYFSFFLASIVDDPFYESNFDTLLMNIWLPLIQMLIFILMGVYTSVLRFLDFSSIFLIVKASILSFITISIVANLRIFGIEFEGIFGNISMIDNRTIFLIFLISFFAIISSRIIVSRLLQYNLPSKKVVIYGAGDAGRQLASALKLSKEMNPVAYVDKSVALQNTLIAGIKVFNPKKLKKLIERHKVDEVLIAMPSASKTILKGLLEDVEKLSVKVRILPGLTDLAEGKVLVSELKEINIPDLIGRFEVEANDELLKKNIKNKTVLITGAGGSIGSELARQVIFNDPQKLIVLDANEYSLYQIKSELESMHLNFPLFSVIGSVTDKKRIYEVCKSFEVDTIYHSAAYKHVPLVEENPFEGVYNNIFGTKHCLDAAIKAEVETFVLISTDKAVRPTNIMGATKRFAELILQSYSDNQDEKNITRMTMVRFGNVLGSSGSALPLFRKQILEGGPLTVTHPDVTRYFMTIPEAAELVIQAGALGEGGDVFVLDMGEPIKILDLAKRLIKLSGMEPIDDENPQGDIEINFTGLRPGEKLYEELLIGNNVSTTEHKRILKAQEDFISSEDLNNSLNLIKEAAAEGNTVALKDILKDVVTGFAPQEKIVDVVFLQKEII